MTMYLGLPLVLTSLTIVLVYLVLRKDHRTFTNRLFAGFLLSMGVWASAVFGMRASPDLAHALPWERTILPAAALTGLLFFHFTLSYTGIRRTKWLLKWLYGFVLFIIAISPTSLLAQGMQLKAYGYAPVLGPAFFLFFAGTYLMAILGLFNLFWAHKNSRVYEERNRYLYLIIGGLSSLIGGASDVLPILGLPLYPGAIIGNTTFCLLASVAIVRYHLFDINLIIRRGTSYLLLSALVAIPYVGIIAVFYELFNQAMPLWANLIVVMALSVGLQPAWRKVQGAVDRIFYRGRWDFLRELEDFSQETHNISHLPDITAPLVKLLYRGLQASSVHLLLPATPKSLTVVSATGPYSVDFGIDNRSPLIAWLEGHKSILHRQDLDIIQQLQSLTDKETSTLKRIRAELFFPLKTKTNELVGLLVIGEKLSRQTYSEEDERLVLTVASRMAIELENALLYAREKASREELQKQNEQKTEFLHAVAHELKTPLTAIISSSELLGSELPSPDESPVGRLVNNITHSAWSMDKRITELLDFARMQIGTLKIHAEDIRVGEVIEEVASVLAVLFNNKDQALSLEVPETLPPVRADRDKLEQVLVNLLSNANKFSPSGTGVVLRARGGQARIIVEVEDSAQPITEAEKKRIFEPYYRGENAEKRQRLPGLGLGLTISRRLIELQHGEMWLETREGKGNIFAFSLPVSRAGGEKVVPAEVNDEGFDHRG
ncbi:MAG: GAF domain-containing protein [Chloroflexi bacterium]|nr:GAF domain-containing protein [Chloroflexota bacterium]